MREPVEVHGVLGRRGHAGRVAGGWGDVARLAVQLVSNEILLITIAEQRTGAGTRPLPYPLPHPPPPPPTRGMRASALHYSEAPDHSGAEALAAPACQAGGRAGGRYRRLIVYG